MNSLRIVLLLILISQLSGCLLTRVYNFKKQFCDYEENFTIIVDDGVVLNMHSPVLLDSDIIWLIGNQPTTRLVSRDQLEMVYVVEKDIPRPDSNHIIPLHLWFIEREGDWLLSTGMINKNLSAILTPGLIEKTVAHICDSNPSVLKKNVEFDLSDLDRKDIPTKRQILEALGTPQQTLMDGRELVYRFRLQGNDIDAEKSYARIIVNPEGNEVEQVYIRYLHYEFGADFILGKGSVSIHL